MYLLKVMVRAPRCTPNVLSLTAGIRADPRIQQAVVHNMNHNVQQFKVADYGRSLSIQIERAKPPIAHLRELSAQLTVPLGTALPKTGLMQASYKNRHMIKTLEIQGF